MKYTGNCHCQKVRFEFTTDKIDTALQCNCSICIRKNAIMSKNYIEPENFKLLAGEDFLSLYQWGDKDVNHYFCSSCGIYTFHDTIYEQGKYRVNLCCVNELEPRQLTCIQFDGKNEL